MIFRRESARASARDEAGMLNHLVWTMVKVVIASLIVGTVMTHFGITTEHIMAKTGLTAERLEELARQGLAWALPNLLVGSLVIVPVWFLFYSRRARSEIDCPFLTTRRHSGATRSGEHGIHIRRPVIMDSGLTG
jgi:hypothetical protein